MVTKSLSLKAVFADNLRRLRQNSQLSQTILAERSGINRANLNRMEFGKNGVTFASLEKLARALKVEPWRFFKVSPPTRCDPPRRARRRKAPVAAARA
jgi:transcriptional regulator with XRE-family HTH domain